MTDNLETLLEKLSGNQQNINVLKELAGEILQKNSENIEQPPFCNQKIQTLQKNIEIISAIKQLLSGNKVYKADIIIKILEISIISEIMKNNSNN